MEIEVEKSVQKANKKIDGVDKEVIIDVMAIITRTQTKTKTETISKTALTAKRQKLVYKAKPLNDEIDEIDMILGAIE